ncbi:sensor histidine kinase [Pseudactinotalea suaedae]|uniref:sensor histidine kinase n=1 Tax=Pseudactinotalea suaedae TaxID=1524924 RepID=UPI0012E1B38E|nr:sensor histidine kinase [Pseudactinotalea suaedae]
MSTDETRQPRRGLRAAYARSARDTGFLLTQLPVAIAGFVLLVLALSLGIPLSILVIGIAVLAGFLAAVNGIGEFTRERLRRLGHHLEEGSRPAPPTTGSWLRRSVRRLRHGQSWMDMLRALLDFPLSITTFVLAIVWWVVGASGIVYWFWSRYLPDEPDMRGLAWLLGLDGVVAEWLLHLVLGFLMLLTAPWVIRGLVAVHVGLERFALLASRPARLRTRIDDLTASRAAVVDSEAHSLRRIERDLHDGPQQRLVRTTMDVQTALRRIDAGDPEAAREHLQSALDQVESGLGELRTLSRGIAPPVLADRGLAAAIGSLAGQSPIRTQTDVAIPAERRLALARETAAYFVVSEALANAGKHSGATLVQIHVDETSAGTLRVRVSDNGRGGAHLGKGHGLIGLVDRLRGVDGTLEVISPEGGGTTVHALIP